MTLSQEEHATVSDFFPRRIPFVDSIWKIVGASVVISDLLTVLFLAVFHQMRHLSAALIISTIISFTMSNLASRTMFKYHKIIRDQNVQLARLNHEIREANKQLQENNAELVAFSHTVAHDLKAPLSGIIGFSQLGMLFAPIRNPKKNWWNTSSAP